MKLFGNNYYRLRQDNIDESVKLKPENRKEIERMTTYLSLRNVNLFALEMTKKDLIGYAKEAESAGISIEESLGMSKKEFCDSRLGETLGGNFFGGTLLSLRKIALVVCALTMVEFMFLGFPKKFGLLFSIFFMVGIWIFLTNVIALKLRLNLGFVEDRKNNLLPGLIAGIVLGAVCSVLGLSSGKWFYMFYGNGWLLVSAVLAVTLVVVLLNNLYWNLQSKKYKWK